MFIYGFWFYHELKNLVGGRPAKHRGDKTDSYVMLHTRNYGPMVCKVSSLRMELFRANPKCVNCERVGSLWILEAHHKSERPHLNLYHVGEPLEGQWAKSSVDGLVMMTKDHIVPKSFGGPNRLENYQTMCSICNNEKGNTMPKAPPLKVKLGDVAPIKHVPAPMGMGMKPEEMPNLAFGYQSIFPTK